MTIVAAFNGIVIGIGALILGVPLAGSIAVVNFAAAYIPYLGAWSAGIFTVLLALGSGGPDTAVEMAIVVFLANSLLQQMIQPIAYGAALGIHPLAVLIVTIAGGALFGAIGLILAAPLTAAAVKISADLARARAEAEEEEERVGGGSPTPAPAAPSALPVPGRVGARQALVGEVALELLQLLRGDRVGVLLGGEAPGAHVLRVLADALAPSPRGPRRSGARSAGVWPA